MRLICVTHDENFTEAVFRLGEVERDGTISVRVEANPKSMFAVEGAAARELDLLRQGLFSLRPRDNFDLHLNVVKRSDDLPF